MDIVGEKEFYDKVNADRKTRKERPLTWEEYQKVLGALETDGEITRMIKEEKAD